MVKKTKKRDNRRLVFNKKAYLKTLEAILAMIFTFSFILYLMPSPKDTVNADTSDVLISLIETNAFRQNGANLSSCEYNRGNTTLTNIIDNELNSYLNYAVCPQGVIPTLPRKNVNVESLYLTGNITHRIDKIIKLYYWE